MLNKKRKILIVGVLVLGVFIYVFTPKIEGYFRWKIAAEAAGALPYQMGLASCIITQCVTTGSPPTCVGAGSPPDPIATPLCNTKGPGVCTTYAVVSGVKAGGMGSNAVFLTTSIAAAGLVCPGGQMIAGGMSPTLMDNGVLASAGGCFGCLVHLDTKSKIKKWFYNFIIAGGKESKK